MKKLKSDGFSVIEGILVISIISLIGGVGFYVYKAGLTRKAPNLAPISNTKVSNTINNFDKCVIDGGKVTFNYEGSTPKEQACGNFTAPYIDYYTAGLPREESLYDVASIKLTHGGSETIVNCGLLLPKTKEVTLTYESDNNCSKITFYSKELQKANTWVTCKVDAITYSRGKANDFAGTHPQKGNLTYLDNYNLFLQDSKVKPLHVGDYYYIPGFVQGITSCIAKNATPEVKKNANKAYQNYQKALESIQ